MRSRRTLQEGEQLPSFSLQDDQGRWISEAQLSKGWVVLYFYPRDETPGCIKEACGFREANSAFEEWGARIWGISPDSVESHQSLK